MNPTASSTAIQPPNGLGVAAAAAPLERLLASIRSQARRWIWVESLALAALAAVAAAWTMVAIDWVVEPPAWVRGCMLAVAVGGVAWILGTRLLSRLAAPLSDASLALAIERTHPEFRDGLSTAVSYVRAGRDGAQADTARSVDRELVGRTIAAAVALVDRVRPAAIFRRRRLARTALAAAVAVVGTAGAAAYDPDGAAVGARRLLLLADEPWPRRVSLEVAGFPGGVRTVARGADVDVVVQARSSGLPPELVELRTRGPGGRKIERMGTRGGPTSAGQAYGHVLKAVGDDLTLEVRGGDARVRGLRIVVADPPAVADIAITYALPDYLGGGVRTTAASRVVRIPRGSAVDIACTSTRPLADAMIAVRGGTTAGGERTLATLGRDGVGARTISGRLPALDADTAVLVRLTGDDGLVNRDPVSVILSAVPDEPPRVSLRLAGISTAVTPQAVLPLEGTISDDHAVAAAAVRLAAGAVAGERPLGHIRGDAPLVEFPSDRPELVPLADLGLTVGARLEVVVSARDTCTLDGEPNVGVGDTWTLDVVSPESLQSLLDAREILLRRRYETAIDDLAKARDAVAGEPAADLTAAATRCGEATVRTAGETAEIAAEFRGIGRELANNGLLTPEIEARLVAQIADPLAGIVDRELAAVARVCRDPAGPDRTAVVRVAGDALARMRTVLERMLELESVNEVIERLRGVIRAQEEIRTETLERQRKRGREALESP